MFKATGTAIAMTISPDSHQRFGVINVVLPWQIATGPAKHVTAPSDYP